MSSEAQTRSAGPQAVGSMEISRIVPQPDIIEIEDLRTIAQAREVEDLQREIWRSSESWIVPSHVLYVVSDCGGILLGARVNGKLAGFVLGFLGGQSGSTLFHASHMLGVLPEHQRHGIGAALKWRQRAKALEQGLGLMTWTFDPLESRNAYFNLHKLGAISRTYREDYYGQMEDGLNQGLPSDRLVVEWHLRDDGPRVPIAGPPRPILLERAGMPELKLDRNGANGPVSIQVPRDVQEIKRTDPDAALAWRLDARRAFRWALDAGYTVYDFTDGAYVLVPPGEITS